MTALVFAIGILVFGLTVYGTVVIGGLLLTDRQLDARPEVPRGERDGADDSFLTRARSLASSEF